MDNYLSLKNKVLECDHILGNLMGEYVDICYGALMRESGGANICLYAGVNSLDVNSEVVFMTLEQVNVR